MGLTRLRWIDGKAVGRHDCSIYMNVNGLIIYDKASVSMGQRCSDSFVRLFNECHKSDTSKLNIPFSSKADVV